MGSLKIDTGLLEASELREMEDRLGYEGKDVN